LCWKDKAKWCCLKGRGSTILLFPVFSWAAILLYKNVEETNVFCARCPIFGMGICALWKNGYRVVDLKNRLCYNTSNVETLYKQSAGGL